MALPLNIFKTITNVISTSSVGIYTAPVGYASVVILAQAVNTGNTTETVTFSHQRTVAGIAVTTEIVKDFAIPSKDSASFLDGKLVLESNDVLVISGSNSSNIKFTGSILETLK
ncbi:MAG: hypothetical protein EBT26_08895 [Microbacteriaceae bacterium]|nr:hypothetical protein [Microbacteriaceae bacterium]